MRPLIPMPAAVAAESGVSELVGTFVRATAGLSAHAAAQLAGVRPETIRKWRRRLPHWIKAETRRRLVAHLAGEPPAPPTDEEGFRRAFHLLLRPVPAE
jgi:hypothetical protein